METETTPQKIKVQKRTITEKQKESLQKARDGKSKKKIIREHNKNSSDFLYPSPYLMGTVLLGLGGLVAYSYMKPEMNFESIVKKSTAQLSMVSLESMAPPKQEKPLVTQETPEPLVIPETPKPQEARFFKSAMRL
jgi:hypothetical protein